MKISTHVVLQVLAVIIQFGAVATAVVPANAKPIVVLVVSAAQGALAWWNHYYQPDGTPVPIKVA